MSTEHTPAQPRAFTGLCVQAVADATGLCRAEIFRLAAIASLGSPRHFFMPTNGQVTYTAEGLCALIDCMELVDRREAAQQLRATLGRERMLAAARAGVTTPDSAEVRGWAARHEAKLEAMEAAA